MRVAFETVVAREFVDCKLNLYEYQKDSLNNKT